MALEFAPMPSLDTSRLVHLLDSLAADYPDRDEQPALPPSTPPGEPSAFPAMMLSYGVVTPRLWAVNNNLGYVLQLQQDRLILNWRAGGAPYPHYDVLKREFTSKWDGILAFCSTRGMPAPEPHTVEFTYVNVIDNDGQTRPTQALRSLAEAEEGLPGSPAGVAYSTRRVLNDETAQGVLTVNAAHDNNPEWMLTVTTRLSVLAAGPLDVLDRAHTLSFDAFVGVTTPAAQVQWGAR